MARKRASMREGPLAELFKATEAAQRQQEREAAGQEQAPPAEEPHESTVEHVPTWEDEVETPVPPVPDPQPEPEPQPEPPAPRPEPVPPAATVPEPPVTRYYEPMPEPAPRLSHARDRKSVV